MGRAPFRGFSPWSKRLRRASSRRIVHPPFRPDLYSRSDGIGRADRRFARIVVALARRLRLFVRRMVVPGFGISGGLLSCALVISIPLGYFSGIGVASKAGVLFKGGSYLDAIARSIPWFSTRPAR